LRGRPSLACSPTRQGSAERPLLFENDGTYDEQYYCHPDHTDC
jgi:hypothetical protein